MATSSEKPKVIRQSIERVPLTLRNRPGSILVVHAFAEKAKAEIRAKQQKKARLAKEARDQDEEFRNARYLNDLGQECVPITALKKSIVSAATAFDDLTKVALRQAIFVDDPVQPGASLIPIRRLDGEPAVGEKREDAVTIGGQTRGLVYRPEYREWMIEVVAEINTRLVSLEQFLALVDHAGWGVGICEGRPEKSSALGWGRFERVEAR